MNFHQKIAVVVMDVLMLAELCLAMYVAHNHPENFTPVFFKIFLGLLIPTLIVTRVVVKRLRTPDEVATES